MTELRQVDNQKLLRELKERIEKNKLGKEEVLQTLESKEIITECEMADISQLTKADWEKACRMLEKDKNYQAEAEL